MLIAFRSLLADESATAAIEYGLVAALVSVACVVAYGAMGTAVNELLTKVSTCLADVASRRLPPCSY